MRKSLAVRAAASATGLLLAAAALTFLGDAPHAYADTEVFNLGELETAFANPAASGPVVILSDDIDSSSTTLSLPASTVLTLDLSGHDLTLARVVIGTGAVLTLTDSSLNSAVAGTLVVVAGENQPGISTSGAHLVVEGTVHVHATGGYYAAGIGGPLAGAPGIVTIRGSAQVTAIGGTLASGIGGGAYQSGDTVTILGSAQVVAVGGNGGAGIGGGFGYDDFARSGGVAIIGESAQVMATGGIGASGIGGGNNGDGGIVAISDSAQVTAATEPFSGSAIGPGANRTELGTLSVDGTLVVSSGSTLKIPAGAEVTGTGFLAGGGEVSNLGAILLPDSRVTIAGITGNNYTVTLNPNGGTVNPASVRVLAESFTAGGRALPDPSRPHADFMRWERAGVVFTESTVLTANTTLNAVWLTAGFDAVFSVTDPRVDIVVDREGVVYRGEGIEVTSDTFDDWVGSSAVLRVTDAAANQVHISSPVLIGAGGTLAINDVDSFAVPLDAAPGTVYTLRIEVGGIERYTQVVTVASWPFLAAPVTIDGSSPPMVHGELTADWHGWPLGGSVIEYQWLRNGTVIAGAESAHYTVQQADLGKQLSVRVTGTNTATGESGPLVRTSAKTSKVIAGPLPPGGVDIAAGTPRVGTVITADDSGWLPGATFAYQWFIDGKAVKGATTKSWTIPASASAKRVSVRVTGSLAGYSATRVIVLADEVVVPGEYGTIPPLSVTGTAAVGSTVGIVWGGSWAPGATLRYQWFLNDRAVAGATKSSWKVPGYAQSGDTITVRVLGVRPGFQTTQTSAGSVIVP